MVIMPGVAMVGHYPTLAGRLSRPDVLAGWRSRQRWMSSWADRVHTGDIDNWPVEPTC